MALFCSSPLPRLLSFSERRNLVLEPWFDFILRCADLLAIFKRLVVTASAGDALIVPNIYGCHIIFAHFWSWKGLFFGSWFLRVGPLKSRSHTNIRHYEEQMRRTPASRRATDWWNYGSETVKHYGPSGSGRVGPRQCQVQPRQTDAIDINSKDTAV